MGVALRSTWGVAQAAPNYPLLGKCALTERDAERLGAKLCPRRHASRPGVKCQRIARGE